MPPDWNLPLDQFLNDPELTDLSWFDLHDFYPALIAAKRWDGTIGGGVGDGGLWSIPVLEESQILAYRKDIFDEHNIKVPTTIEELADAARMVKEHTGIPGIVARGTPSVATVFTGFLAGLKSYTDGTWSELDPYLNPQFTDPWSVKFTQVYMDMIRESGPPNWPSMQQSLPSKPYEAALVDGAGPAAILRHITLPLLSPFILLVVTLRAMDSLRIFDVIYATTSGGPADATTTLHILTFQYAFQYYQMGKGMAQAMVLLVLVVIASYILISLPDYPRI